MQTYMQLHISEHSLNTRYVAFQPERGDGIAARGSAESAAIATCSFAADCGRDSPLLTEASLLSWMFAAGASACVTRLRSFLDVFTQARSWAGR